MLKCKPKSELLGEVFHRYRINRRYTKEYVAEYLGHPTAERVGLYEKGEAGIPLNEAYAISNCLGISPEVILGIVNGDPDVVTAIQE